MDTTNAANDVLCDLNNMPPCIVCARTDFICEINIGAWSVAICQSCRQGIICPMPTPESLASFYDSAYFKNHYEEEETTDPLISRQKLIRHQQHRINRVRRYKPRGRLLDIGCGKGDFLYAASLAGYEAEGTDVSTANATRIENLLQCRVHTGTELDFSAESFDVITLWHTLEHHQDPRSTLRQCLQWLRPDGIIVIEVPNHASIDATKFGSAWPDWDLPFHLHHFTHSSLPLFLSKCGLQFFHIHTYHSHYVRNILSSTGILKPVARIAASFFHGNSVLAFCRKP